MWSLMNPPEGRWWQHLQERRCSRPYEVCNTLSGLSSASVTRRSTLRHELIGGGHARESQTTKQMRSAITGWRWAACKLSGMMRLLADPRQLVWMLIQYCWKFCHQRKTWEKVSCTVLRKAISEVIRNGFSLVSRLLWTGTPKRWNRTKSIFFNFNTKYI